ncbi:MAG: hypothetical protein R2706_20595 [Acidimicrobiales bacterium]
MHSTTAATEVASLADGLPHVYSLIRRPGLLVWLIDDVEVFRVTGDASAHVGAHRSGSDVSRDQPGRWRHLCR